MDAQLAYLNWVQRQELDVVLDSTLSSDCCPQCGRPACRGGRECEAAIEAYARENADETAEIEAEMRREHGYL